MHARQNTRLHAGAKAGGEKLQQVWVCWTQRATQQSPRERARPREREREREIERERESGHSEWSFLCSSWRRPSCGSINDFFVWCVAEWPLVQPPGISLRLAAVVSSSLFSSSLFCAHLKRLFTPLCVCMCVYVCVCVWMVFRGPGSVVDRWENFTTLCARPWPTGGGMRRFPEEFLIMSVEM